MCVPHIWKKKPRFLCVCVTLWCWENYGPFPGDLVCVCELPPCWRSDRQKNCFLFFSFHGWYFLHIMTFSHTSRPVFMLQSRCFVWVTRHRLIDILIQITKHNWAKGSSFIQEREENRLFSWADSPGLIWLAGHVWSCCKMSNKRAPLTA